MSGILVFSYGNPGRGDDALGPAFVECLQLHDRGITADIECLTDMQLQVEHVMDLCGRGAVLFVDADASCAPPYQMTRIFAVKDSSYTSHAMSPEALLHAYHHVYGIDAPPAFLLRIRGYNFGLGEPMSKQARANLDEAIKMVPGLGTDPVPEHCRQLFDCNPARS